MVVIFAGVAIVHHGNREQVIVSVPKKFSTKSWKFVGRGVLKILGNMTVLLANKI